MSGPQHKIYSTTVGGAGPGMPGPYRSAGGYSTAPPLYTTVTSVSQSPVTAYLPLPAGIK